MKKLILLIFICNAVIGCSPIFYIPNTQNVPMIKEKRQTNFMASVGKSADANTFEFQAAYGLTNKIALQLNSFLPTLLNADKNSFKGYGSLVEFGGGYYKMISPLFIFETYGLIGFGTIENKLPSDSVMPNANIKANYNRIGLQPSLSCSTKYFATSISSRISNLNYNHIRGNIVPDMDYLKGNSSHWLFEPALTLQAGLKNFKFQVQYVYSFNLTHSDFYQDLNHISFGLKFNIPNKRNTF